MAFAIEQDGIDVRVYFRDADEDVTSRLFHMRWDTDLATTLTNVTTFVGIIAAMTDAEVADYVVSLPYNDAAASSADSTSENQEVAAIVMTLAVDPPAKRSKHGTIEIPSPADGVKQGTSGAASNEVDLTATPVTNMLAQFQSSGNAYLSSGQDAVALKRGKIYFKGSPKKQRS